MKTYFRILQFVKPYWKHLTLSVFFTIFYALFNGASIYLTIPLLDTLFQETANKKEVVVNTPSPTSTVMPGFINDLQHQLSEAFKSFVFSGTKTDALLKICILVFGAFMLKNIFGYIQAYFLAYVEQAAMRDLRNQAFKHLHQLPMSYFKKEKTGNLISRITNDIGIVQGSIGTVFLNMVREPLTIIVFLGMAVTLSWQLTALSFLVLPFSMLIIVTVGIRLRKYSTNIQAKIADITSLLQETISGVKIVKAFGMEKWETKKFFKESNNYFKLVLYVTRVRNISSPLTELVSVLIGVVIIYYGGILVLSNQSLTASEFLGFLFAIFQMMPPIKELGGVNNKIQETSAAADRVFEIIDANPVILDTANPKEVEEFKTSIKFDKVTFQYDDAEEPVLKELDFEVKKGEIIAIVGPSGGGKSTLIDLLPRFYDPTDGKILLDGIDIKELKISNLRSLMGIVTQETFLFNESIAENIAYGLEDFPKEKIIEAAKIANAHNFIMEMPEGYSTVIGERGVKLSGGQRQRLSIARALVKNPAIMIFDEATSALDNESELLVQEAIERLMADRTTFVIAHRLSTIRNATKILVVEKGKIIQTGTHDELILNENGMYKKLYEMQFRSE